MTEKHIVYKALFVSFLLCLSTILSPLTGYPAAKDRLQKGLECKQRLMSSEPNKRLQHQWERCIAYFSNLIEKETQDKKVEEALFRLGELYEGLSRYSGDRRFREAAVDHYQRVIKQFPEGRFVKAAQRALISLGVPLPAEDSKIQSPSPPANPVLIKNIHHWSFPSYTRVVVELAQEVEYRQDRLSKPDRLLIDLKNAVVSRVMHNKPITVGDGILKEVNIAQFKPDTVRVVFNLGDIQNYRIVPFSNPDRLVIDIFGMTASVGEIAEKDLEDEETKERPDRTQDQLTLAQQLGLGINTIVIDPGHGGKDPGAIGKSGLMEKDVVLDIALKLRNLLEKQLSKRVILTRESDVFIPLDERTLIANAKKADLFISIHTNSSPKKKTRGVEIYLVGQSTDRTAMATAARENSASERAMSDLEVILNDLLENTKIDESLELAHTTRRSFLKTVGAHYNHTVDLGVKRAPFYVLINANMPSILAEVAFISNPTEEQRLSNETYRQRIAEALFEGIRDYIASIKVASS